MAILHNTPYHHSKIINEQAEQLKLTQHIYRARTRKDVNRIAYEVFFDILHEKGAVQQVLRTQYKQRWCAPSLITVRLAGRSIRFLSDAVWNRLTSKACKNLLWLSRRVPARVHLANLRLHFNGWHTSARYQQRAGSTCLFCSQEGSEDSLEHILVCPFIHSLSPPSFKKGAPPRLPIKHFFLFGLDGKHRIAMAVFVFALYTMHNELRHSADKSERRHCISRIAGDACARPAMRHAWRDVFGWGLGYAPTVRTSRPVVSALQEMYPNKHIDDILLTELAQV